MFIFSLKCQQDSVSLFSFFLALFSNSLILPYRLLKGSELHLLCGSAVMCLMMKILNSSHLSHELYWVLGIESCFRICPCQDPSICTGFHLMKLQVSCPDLIFAAADCMFLDLISINFKRLAIYQHQIHLTTLSYCQGHYFQHEKTSCLRPNFLI